MQTSLAAKIAQTAPVWVLAIFFLVVFNSTMPLRSALYSSDAFMHLRLGLDILHSGSLPRIDELSFTAAGRPYAAHEWAFEVISALAFKARGLAGLLLMTALFGALASTATFTRMRNKGASIVGSLAALALIWRICATAYSARPQIVSDAALALTLLWLDCGLWKRPGFKQPLMVLALTALWTWFHPVSIFFVLILALDTGMDAFLDRTLVKASAATVGAAAIAILCSPYGLAVPLHIVQLALKSSLVSQIEEHMPLETTHTFLGALIMAEVAVVASYVFISFNTKFLKRPRPGEALALIAMAALGFHSQRWMVLFSIMCAPWLALAFDLAGRSICALATGDTSAFSSARQPSSREPKATLWPAYAAVVTMACAYTALRDNAAVARLSLNDQPVAAAEFVRDHPSLFEGRMVNPYGFGGFLSFVIPEHKVFIDGRAEFYPTEVILDSVTIRDGLSGALSVADKWRIDWAFCKAGTGAINVFQDAGWQTVYQDQLATLFTRPK